MSETKHAREFVLSYCRGVGVDIGCGNDKINADAVGIDFEYPYENEKHSGGLTSADFLGGWDEYFKGERKSLDYIYSSHLLEDYEDAETVLRRWSLQVRVGGRIVLWLPNERLYQKHCEEIGQTLNEGHSNSWNGSADFWDRVGRHIAGFELESSGDPSGYSFYVVMRRVSARGLTPGYASTVRRFVSAPYHGRGVEFSSDSDVLRDESLLLEDIGRLRDADDRSLDYIAFVGFGGFFNEPNRALSLASEKLKIDGSLLFVYPHESLSSAPNASSEERMKSIVEGSGCPFSMSRRGVDDGGSESFFVEFTRYNDAAVFIPQYSGKGNVAAPLLENVKDGALQISRLDGVGDMVFMTPAVKRLKRIIGDTRLVLHTRPQYAGIHKLIGFDDVVVSDDKRDVYEDGVGFNWALEVHRAARVVDRVSLWEDVFHLPISNVTLSMDRALIESTASPTDHRLFDERKKTIYLSPFSVFAGRSFSPSNVVEIASSLSRDFNVVMTAPASDPPLPLDADAAHIAFAQAKVECLSVCESMGCCVFRGLSVDEWFSVVSQCDAAVSSDTAGMYVAAAFGVPSVGFYEHVEPWLRLRRFQRTRGVSVRSDRCRCSHHGPCVAMNESCHDLITPRVVVNNVDAVLRGEYGYYHVRGSQLVPPKIHFVVDTSRGSSDDLETTLASIRTATRGVDFSVSVDRGSRDEDIDKCIAYVDAGTAVSRFYVWEKMKETMRQWIW